MSNSDFVGSFLVDSALNYRLRPLGTAPNGGAPAAPGVDRTIGLAGVLEDSSPNYCKGRLARIFLSTKPLDQLSHSVVAFDDGHDDDEVDVFLTVSDTLMDKVEMIMLHDRLKGCTLHVSGSAARRENAAMKPGAFDIKHFDFCWHGPASGRLRAKK